MRWLLLAVVVACGAARALGGEFNQVLSVGDAAPSWSELPGTDGKQHALDDFKDKQIVVVVFTCNSCPFAVAYEDRIIEFAKTHPEVGVVAINVNRVPEDGPAKMAERAQQKGFPYPYVYDESQKVAKDYGAQITPEFFVLNAERKIVYMGGMDDNSEPAGVKVNYLEPAVKAALAGTTPETKETYARGCKIRYARERK